MALWAHHQARRSIYNRGRGDEAEPPMPISPRPGPRSTRGSGPGSQRPSEPSSRPAAGSGVPGVMGRAGEPGLRGRNGGRLRDPLCYYSRTDGPPAPRGAHPSGLWPLDLPPPVRWPPAGPRRRLPYLRSPDPPFYFLKPSHKAPRRPRLSSFLPETPARAHFPSRHRAWKAARACALNPAGVSSVLLLGLGQVPSTRLGTNRPRLLFPPIKGAWTGQGTCAVPLASVAGNGEHTFCKGARRARDLDNLLTACFPRGSQWWESESGRARRWKASSR